MIRLFYGAGTSQTRNALTKAIQDDIKNGKKVVLLVPEQEAVITEKRMLRLLPPSAQLSFEVLNFSRLANRVFRTVGGLSYRYATPAVTSLTMWRVLRRISPFFRLFGKNTIDRALTDRMLSAIAQCKAYCITPQELLEAANKMEQNDPLKDKLNDISLSLAAYTTDLRVQFDDVADDLTRAADLIAANKKLFADTEIYIDSFTDFTAQELHLIDVLLRTAPTLSITTPLLSLQDGGIHLASSALTVQRLIHLAREAGCEITYQKAVSEKPRDAAAYVARNLFAMDAEPAPLLYRENSNLYVTRTASPYTEAEYVANTVKRLINEGYRYRDITVIARDTNAYLGIIDAALEKEGIPFYLSEKTDITTRPLIKLVLFALRIHLYNWQTEDVIGFLKTGLCRITPEKINFFEEYAKTWRLRGKRAFAAPFAMNPDGYSDRVSARGERILTAANATRELFVPHLLTFFDELDAAKSATEACEAIYRFLLSLDLQSTLKEQASEYLSLGERREAEELVRLFDVTVSALEAISQTLGEEQLSTVELYDALCLVFTNTNIGVIPTSADEVMIGSAATLRAEPSPIVFIIGLNEGAFPAPVTDTGILSDAEKQRLATLGITLSADNATAASDELFYLYRAFSLATQRLYLSYNERTTAGKASEPSIAISRVNALMKDLAPVNYNAIPARDKIFSPQGALEHYAELSPAERAAITALLSEDEAFNSKREATEQPVVDTDAAISPSEAAEHFGPGSFHPTGIEKFVSCKFAYYCNRVLALREEANDALTSAAIGTFMHYVFENTLSAARAASKRGEEPSEAEIDALVNKCVTEYREHLVKAGGTLSPRAAALVERLHALAGIATKVIFEDLRSSPFTPTAFEIDLSSHGAADIKLENNTHIPLSGKVDRVDAYTSEDGHTYLRIVDYKTGRKVFTLEDVEKGECLQMPLYLYALCHGDSQILAKKLGLPQDTLFAPGGLTYFSTAIGNEHTPYRIPKEEALASAAERLKQSGITLCDEADSELVLGDKAKKKSNVKLCRQDMEQMFEELTVTIGEIATEMQSGNAQIAPNVKKTASPCNYCKFFPICRAAQKTSF